MKHLNHRFPKTVDLFKIDWVVIEKLRNQMSTDNSGRQHTTDTKCLRWRFTLKKKTRINPFAVWTVFAKHGLEH